MHGLHGRQVLFHGSVILHIQHLLYRPSFFRLFLGTLRQLGINLWYSNTVVRRSFCSVITLSTGPVLFIGSLVRCNQNEDLIYNGYNSDKYCCIQLISVVR